MGMILLNHLIPDKSASSKNLRVYEDNMFPLIFSLLLLTVQSFPVDEEANEHIQTHQHESQWQEASNQNVEEIKKALEDVTYVQKFKSMMADYVKSQYNNLTHHQMETIRDYLEEFCLKFASDLKDIIENHVFIQRDVIDDGLPDSTFDSVKDCIKTELAMNESIAEQITYVLRKNLFLTRQKIDKIIYDSKISAIENL